MWVMAKLLKLSEVLGMLKCASKTTIYKYINFQAFPKPIKLSSKMARWDVSEVEKWIEERKQQRNMETK